jgi:isopenicillin-N epimerase
MPNIDGAFGDQTCQAGDVRSRVHSGTLDAAAFLTAPTALVWIRDAARRFRA